MNLRKIGMVFTLWNRNNTLKVYNYLLTIQRITYYPTGNGTEVMKKSVLPHTSPVKINTTAMVKRTSARKLNFLYKKKSTLRLKTIGIARPNTNLMRNSTL